MSGFAVAQSFSLVLPCYNEEDSIRPFLEQLVRNWEPLLQGLGLEQLEVIVVNDASSDRSQSELEAFQPWIQIIQHSSRLGYGAALKTGIRVAKGSLVGFCDLDSTYDPLDFIPMWKSLRDGSAQMVIGNRLHNLENMPISRSVGNFLFRASIQLMFGRQVMDSCSGQRLFRSKDSHLLTEGLPNQLNYSLAMTLRFVRLNKHFSEVPIRYYRRLGRSKLKIFQDGISFFSTILLYRIMPESKHAERAEILVNE